MKVRPNPIEPARVAALHEYQILHKSEEAPFDEIVRLAAESCGTQVALINFCTGEKNWSKARVGTGIIEVNQDQSFCRKVIESKRCLVIADARNDPEFAAEPYVHQFPFVRAYLGVPLQNSDGVVLGSLCVIDTKPRKFTAKNIAQLEYFSRQIMTLMDLRKTQSALNATQKELSKQHQILFDAKRHQREFLSSLSHEVRGPLNAILGLSEILLAEELPPYQSRLLNDLSRSGQGLIETLNAFLEHSKIEAGHFKLNLSFFSLKTFIEETLSPYEVLAQNKGLKFSHVLKLPDPCHCQADRVRIRQVLNNLVSNALKYTDSGSIRVEVECTDSREEESLFAFRVIDTGIGVHKNHFQQLFEPYLQVSGDSSKGGTGLGLSICRKIVESMGGQIGVESELGAGSNFWFMVAFKTSPAASNASVIPLNQAHPHLSGLILLLEDNSISSQVTLSFLEKSGLEVLSARTLDESIYLLDTHNFDLILMDLHLGAVLPSTLLHDVRQKSCAPIIAISGTEIDSRAARELDIDDTLQKPYTKEALLRKLQYWLLVPKDQHHRVREWTDSLTQLEEQCGIEFVQNTVANFVLRHPAEIYRLHHFLEGGQLDKLELAAHSMKSTLATLGLMHLARLCHEIEELAISADHALVGQVLDQFGADSRRTYNQLMNYVRRELNTREKTS